MRRLLPTVRSFLLHSGQTVVLVAVGAMAMAAAPLPTVETSDNLTRPVAPPVTAKVQTPGPVTREMVFVAPVKGHVVNSPFGVRKLSGEAHARAHKGVDIAAPKGTGVFATAEGRVTRTGYDAGGYGNFIELTHPNGMTSLYGHLSRVDVARGMAVSADQRIGLVGSTGYSTGPHLHFEVRRGGAQINPAKVVGRAFRVVIRPA